MRVCGTMIETGSPDGADDPDDGHKHGSDRATDPIASTSEPLNYERPPTLWVPKTCPGRSGGVFIFVEESAESIATADAEVCDRAGVGDRCG